MVIDGFPYRIHPFSVGEAASPFVPDERLIRPHLLKAVGLWTDIGLGDFGLYYIRDKQKHEVDFLVAKDRKPWFLVECKTSPKEPLSEPLTAFQMALSVPYAFQVAVHADKTDIDPTEYRDMAIKTSVLDLMKVLV